MRMMMVVVRYCIVSILLFCVIRVLVNLCMHACYMFQIKDYRLILCSCRSMSGLVRPRPLVAGEEVLVAKDAFHAGPVRRPGRRQARVHKDAQERARSSARPPGRRRQDQLLVQRLCGRRQTVQGIRSVLALTITAVVMPRRIFRKTKGSARKNGKSEVARPEKEVCRYLQPCGFLTLKSVNKNAWNT